MPYPVPHYDVPIVDKDGTQTRELNDFFNSLQSLVNGLQQTLIQVPSSAAGQAAAANAIAVQALTRPQRGHANDSRPAAFEPRSARPTETFIPTPQRRWSITKVIPDTEANIGNWLASVNPESLYVATDTFKIYYSGDGTAWVQLAFISDAAYGAGWNGIDYLAPSQNAVYDEFVAVLAAIAALLPSTVASVRLTGQTADLGPTNFANSATGTQFDVLYYLETTTADLAAGGVQVNIVFTDDIGAQTVSSIPVVLTGLGTLRASGVIPIVRTAGSIAYSTTHTGIFGSSQYAVSLTLRRNT